MLIVDVVSKSHQELFTAAMPGSGSHLSLQALSAIDIFTSQLLLRYRMVHSIEFSLFVTQSIAKSNLSPL